MSQYYKGITFADQNASPIDDAVIRRMLLSDGVLAGCDFSYAGHTLTMASGYIIACGRQIRHPTAENWAITDASSGYARVLMTIDMTRTSTEEVFDQVNTSIEYATSEDGFPALIQDDINATGSQYQVALAVVSLGTGGITGIVSKLELAESSGGGGLNFSVVGGTTQPSSPKENTIWVNTDAEITGWAFSSAEPDSPSEGMVWFFTQKYSPVAINILRKNSIMVYPTAAYQYISGAWVSKTAQSYIGGQWLDFVLYLYDTGDECIEVSGGWTSAGKQATSGGSAAALAPTITRGDTTIKAAISSEGYAGVFYAVNKVDLTEYTKLIAKGTFYNSSTTQTNFRLAVWSSLSTYYQTNIAAYVIPASKVVTDELELNVSGLTGEHTIGFVINTYSGSSSYVTLSECYLT